MKYERAREFGLEMGLELPAEFVNNITWHAMNLFVYADIERELAELRLTAREAGVRFSAVCYDAVLDGDSVDEPCYICRQLKAGFFRE